MAIVEELLRAFASQTKKQKTDGNEDEEHELAALTDLVSKYKERALNDPWILKAIESL